MSFYRRHAVVVFWAMMVIVYAIAIEPYGEAPSLGTGDKIDHIAAFLTLTILGHVAYPRTAVWWLGAGLSMFGAAIELTQAIPFLNRDASVLDWLADTVAIAGVLAISRALKRYFPARAST